MLTISKHKTKNLLSSAAAAQIGLASLVVACVDDTAGTDGPAATGGSSTTSASSGATEPTTAPTSTATTGPGGGSSEGTDSLAPTTSTTSVTDTTAPVTSDSTSDATSDATGETSDSTTDPGTGSSTDESASSSSGGSSSGGGPDILCAPGELQCVAPAEFQTCARDGLSWVGPAKCGPGELCQGDQCVHSCNQLLGDPSSIGCLYYAIDANNDPLDNNDADQYGVLVANTTPGVQSSVDVQVYTNGAWTTIQSAPVAPGQFHQFNLPDRHVNYTDFNARGAFRIVSQYPITAFQFQPVSANLLYSSDASLLLPAHTFEKNYYLVGWGVNTIANAQIDIVAAADDTHVTITPTVKTAAGGPIPAMQAGQPHMLPTMMEGDVIQIETTKGKVSGTYITADKPIAVFTTHWCANVPSDDWSYCDHLEEQLPGLAAWGKTHVASRLPVRKVGTPEPTFWQLFAAEDATKIHIDHHAEVTGIVADDFVMSKGQLMFLTVGGTAANPGDFVVTADKPIFMMQYMSSGELTTMPAPQAGDPAMVQSVPVEQLRSNYVVASAAPWEFDWPVLTKPTGSNITVDGVTVTQDKFITIGPAGMPSGWEVARIPTASGRHVLDGDQPFSAVLAGYGVFSSYAYPAGTSLKQLNP